MTKKRFFIFSAIFLMAAAAIPAGFFFSAGKILSFPASKPKKSDLIVVLGGDSGFRAPKALELLKSLEPRGESQETKKQNVLIIGTEGQAKMFAAKSGIFTENIFNDPTPKNTREEGANTLVLMMERNWKSAIVVSDPYHMLRVWYAWSKVFKHSGMKFTLVATDPDWWDAKKWWKNEKSRRFVISEYLKLGYFIYVYNFDSKYFDSRIEHSAKGIEPRDKRQEARAKSQELEHKRLREIEKKWENKIDGWISKVIDR